MSLPFMKLYPSDYMGDTRHLSTEQHGAYLLLLMAMWNAGGSLPDDDAKLARITGLSRTRWLKHRPDLVAFFQIENGAFHHKRMDEEVAAARAVHEKRAAAGRASGAIRSGNSTKNGQLLERVRETNPLKNNDPGRTHVPQPDTRDQKIINYSNSVAAREPDRARPFPSDGSISFSEPFVGIARRWGGGADVDILASAFRQFCRGADMDLADRQIARKFETFCQKHRISGRVAA